MVRRKALFNVRYFTVEKLKVSTGTRVRPINKAIFKRKRDLYLLNFGGKKKRGVYFNFGVFYLLLSFCLMLLLKKHVTFDAIV